VAGERVLAVDDEADILELLEYNLEENGYKATCVATGEEAIEKARLVLPDLVLLDLMLPGVDGLEVARTLKRDEATAHIPIIMLTAKGAESDIIVGLELGADDYVTKPFSPRVLLARIRAVLRRKTAPPAESEGLIKRGDLTIDPERREVLVKKKPVELTFTEFEVLRLLASRPGRVYTRGQIIDAVKGSDYPVTDRSVDVQIAGLRKNLGRLGDVIETVRGVGYRFRD
jgi:two-component system phosphate regulon response regulator PhoB